MTDQLLIKNARRRQANIKASSLEVVVAAWEAGGKKPSGPPKPDPQPQPIPLRPSKKSEAPTIVLGVRPAAQAAVDPVIAAQAAAAIAEANRRKALRDAFAKSVDDYNRSRGF